MVVFTDRGVPKPSDWDLVEPGEYELVYKVRCKGEWVTVRRVMYGSAQCEVCGQPLDWHPGESGKCNDCIQALGRYRAHTLKDRRYLARLREWLEEGAEEKRNQGWFAGPAKG